MAASTALDTTRIPASDIQRAYAGKFGMNVGRFFPGDDVALERVEPYGFYRFTPAEPGDDRFYSELMQRIGYDDGEKAEFRAAADEVGSAGRVLDVGCGPGRFAEFCRGDYKGIELNPDAVAEAQRLGRNVVLERLEDQPEGAFDAVTLFQVLEHVSDPAGFLAEAARRVAPGGKLLVSTPDMAGHLGREVNHVLNYPPHHLSWWSEEAIGALMRANGLGDVTVWHEPLQALHVPSWLFSKLHPRGARHFDWSLRAKLAKAVAKVGSWVIRPLLGTRSRINGQCVMVVGRRAA